jgi:surfactin synthase thioesterase subunit
MARRFAVSAVLKILPAAAEFVKQAVPTAEVHYFDGGHFVLDEYADAIAEAIIETLSL